MVGVVVVSVVVVTVVVVLGEVAGTPSYHSTFATYLDQKYWILGHRARGEGRGGGNEASGGTGEWGKGRSGEG